MPKISFKGLNMPDSPIRKLTPIADGAKALGRHVIHLNIGQPDVQTPPMAMEAVRSMDRTVLEYSPSEGFVSYRKGLASYYSSVGVDVTPEQIMVTTGGSEALVFAFMACLDPGDEVIIPMGLRQLRVFVLSRLQRCWTMGLLCRQWMHLRS